MNKPSPIIVWFQQDLRIYDNPALYEAAQTGRPVIPVYILDEEAAGDWRPGAASRWWLHHSLRALQKSLKKKNANLLVFKGGAIAQLSRLFKETRAGALYWNRCYEPWRQALEKDVLKWCGENNIETANFNAGLIREPWTVKKDDGAPYKVFTPFYKAGIALREPPEPLPEPDQLNPPSQLDAGVTIDELGLLPEIRWDKKLEQYWRPGESGAQERFHRFLEDAVSQYKTGRDRPDKDFTSGLSPHLHHGEIGPRQIWHETGDRSEPFLREIYWREFCYNLLHHFPDFPEEPMQDKFKNFPWEPNKKQLKAWQKGLTGYPIVDAGMRQLWETGWMHNRVRMIVGSFLVKDLRIHWSEGEKWFWDCLVDADLANNSAGWQWIAGCGADAAPYFRVFNPVTQGLKFDPEGDYVRRFVPELGEMPAKHIHAPWEAPEKVVEDAGVKLGETYPHPIVDHKQERQNALAAFESLKEAP